MSEAKKREKKLAYAKTYYMENRDALIKYARNKCDYKKKRVALEDDNPNEIVPSVPIAPPPKGKPPPPPANLLPKKPFKIEKPGKVGNKWIEALKIYNKGKKWSVPKKGSAEYVEVKKIMDGMSFSYADPFKKGSGACSSTQNNINFQNAIEDMDIVELEEYEEYIDCNFSGKKHLYENDFINQQHYNNFKTEYQNNKRRVRNKRAELQEEEREFYRKEKERRR